MPVSCKMKLHINRSAWSIFVWFTFYNSWVAMYRHLHEVCLPAGVHHKFKSQKYPAGWWAQATPLWLQNCRSLPPWFRSPGICFCLSVKSLRKDPLHKCVTHKNAWILPSCVRISASPGPAEATNKFEQTQVWRWLWPDKSRHWSPWDHGDLWLKIFTLFPSFLQKLQEFLFTWFLDKCLLY